MEIKSKLLTIVGGLALAACSNATAADGYKVSVSNLPEEINGSTLFIVNFDNGEKVDSVTVKDGAALFSGTIEEPMAVRFVIDGNRLGSFILENGDVNIDAKVGASSPLNDKNGEIVSKLQAIAEEGRYLKADSAGIAKQQELMNSYNTILDKALSENINNPIGYLLFLNKAYELNYDELKSFLAANPSLKKYKRVNALVTAAENKMKTQPGHKFLDFEIKNDSTVQKLSDYAGQGKLLLVDFWASWCGPCIRETKVLKKLYEEYGDKLEILGVAVWDEPENTLAAIEQHKLPWKHIINAQTIPTDLYGISGIPCIILIAPDGTILSRDKQDEALVADVKAAIEGTLAPETVKAGAK